MPRYVAFLRGVSPMNAKMPALKRAFETAGFTNVETVLSSGNVVFDASRQSEARLARRAEAAMQQELGRTFSTFVRRVDVLETLLASDPYAEFAVPAEAKRVVIFLRGPARPKQPLPIALDDARLLVAKGQEAFAVYVPGPEGPVFMRLIEKTLGKDVTTRTWETVTKCAARRGRNRRGE